MYANKIFLGLLLAVLVAACGPKKPVDEKAYYQVKVAVDETFKPIIEEEAKVFNARYPDADMQFHYVPETEAINLLLKDSIRMIMCTRPLSKSEVDGIASTYQLRVKSQMVAYDAVALIVNPSNPDTLLSVSELRKIMQGKITRWDQLQGSKTVGNLEVVFDNSNSSTVRYIRDSICGGAELKGSLKTGKNNSDVIKYVAETPNAIGIIGVDWLRNNADTTNLSFNSKIRVMSLTNSAVKNSQNCFQPVQYYIATGDYPLTRSVYLITTDPRTRALALNFYYFVSDQDGQLIITKSSQLLPYMPVHIRTVEVSD